MNKVLKSEEKFKVFFDRSTTLKICEKSQQHHAGSSLEQPIALRESIFDLYVEKKYNFE